ncbi:MAG TPA: PfkB family carbohydrate kinase [Solirubrobacteraceae bacterium]|jgi:ribokinase|nr:PfkB family carbohydrate kinase [Solirubrobacteraceae bacterium]
MNPAVVGHIEWVEFARVPHVPRAGEVVNASETWDEAAGGGAVTAVALARLAGRATLYTALGDDELGRRAQARLERLGVVVHAAIRDEPTRRALTFVDDAGERTITTIGDRLAPRGADPLPWELLADDDCVYFTAGDPAALEAARQARVLVMTPRARVVPPAGVRVDALVFSAGDPSETRSAVDLVDRADVVVATEGALGGGWSAASGSGRWEACAVPGPIVDSYGCGDSFAAGLTYGLGADLRLPDALGLAARCGAACLSGRGPYAGQLIGPG